MRTHAQAEILGLFGEYKPPKKKKRRMRTHAQAEDLGLFEKWR